MDTIQYIQGGGTACYIRDDLRYAIIEAPQISNINDTEYLLLSIDCARKLLIGSIYRRPKGRSLGNFFASLQNIDHSYKNVVLARDLNSDLLIDDFYSSNLRQLIFEQSLYLVPFGATHHLENSDTWLDIIKADNATKIRSHEKSAAPFISGHDYLIVDYVFNAPAKQEIELLSRDFRKFSSTAFSNAMKNELSTQIPTVGSVNGALQCFQNLATKLLDQHAPWTSRKLYRRPVPWFTQELRDKYKERDRLFKRAKHRKSIANLNTIGFLTIKSSGILEKLETRILLKNCTDKSKTWNVLRKYGLIRNNLKSPLHFFDKLDLIDYYSSVTCSHPPCSAETLRNILLESTYSESDKFKFSPMDRIEVHQSMLACLPKARSRSCDGLSLSYFNSVLPAIVPFFTELFNLSISSYIYSDI